MTEVFGWMGFIMLVAISALAIDDYISLPKWKRKKLKIICFHDWHFNARFDDVVIMKCRKCGKFKRVHKPIEEEKEEGK